MNYKRFLNDVKKSLEDGTYNAVIEEKTESAQIWGKIVSLAEGISDSVESKDYIVTTAKYGFYLFSIIQKMYLISIAKLKNDLSYKVYEQEYEALWKQWQELHDTKDCCPSLYIKEDKPMDLIGYGGNVGFDCVLRDI